MLNLNLPHAERMGSTEIKTKIFNNLTQISLRVIFV